MLENHNNQNGAFIAFLRKREELVLGYACAVKTRSDSFVKPLNTKI